MHEQKETQGKKQGRKVRNSRFPMSTFWAYLGMLFLISGIHTGLLVWMGKAEVSEILQTHLTLLYWILVAAGITFYARWLTKRHYEKPMHDLADATRKVAEGDFSIYVPPTHTSDKLDYIDLMLEDFNKMVGELGNVETLKTDFFSNVSHEIKTPLAVIQNNAELLKRSDLSEEQEMYVQSIYLSSKRLSELIGNILKLNKLEKQTILPELCTYDLCAQLAECAVAYEEIWERQHLDFEAEMEDSVMISADPSLMELVWNNLISNAVKFTEPGGTVTLTEDSDEESVRVSICDTGCGMEEETKKRIFDKFYQGDTSHSMAGNGLGLSLVRRVLELNGFQIEVESKIGVGSTFTVTMPKAIDRKAGDEA